MKNVKFVLPLIPILLLTSCGITFSNKKGDVIIDAVMKANTAIEMKNIYELGELKTGNFQLENSMNFNQQNGGFILSVDNEGKASVYSILTESNIIDEIGSGFGCNSYDSDISGGYFIINNGVTNVYDALGNHLFVDSDKIITSISDGVTSDGSEYADVQDNEGNHYFYVYENGVPTLKASLNENDYESGSSYVGDTFLNLTNYGHKGYKAYYYNKRIIVFDNNNNEITSFAEPAADNKFFIGDFYIYQKSTLIDDYNNNYDYLDASGNRYILETYRLNYLTGDVESIDVDYVLTTTAVSPFYNARKVYAYVSANLKKISEKKTLSSNITTCLIDENGATHEDVTGIDLNSFERFGHNYYNTQNQTIYDGNLNEISILTGLSPVKVNNAGLIVCKKDNLYGAINEEGKVVIPFKFKTIYTDYMSDNSLLAKDNAGDYCVLSFNARFATYAVSKVLTDLKECEVTYLGGDAYKFTDETVYPYILHITNGEVKKETSISTSKFYSMTGVISASAADKAKYYILEVDCSHMYSLYNFQVADYTINHR